MAPRKASKTTKPKPKPTTGQVKPGAPTTLTREILTEFAALMAAGNYFSTVCAYMDIPEKVAYDWRNKGDAGDDATGPDPNLYREFSKSVTRAEARAEVRAAALLQQASQDRVVDMPVVETIGKDGATRLAPDISKLFVQGDWRAIAEFMARRYPKRWSKAERVAQELTGPNGAPVQHQFVVEQFGDDDFGGGNRETKDTGDGANDAATTQSD